MSKHHYVPQGYLRGFSADENSKMVWVYDKKYANGKAPIKTTSIKSICHLENYYTLEGSPHCLEKTFADIENEVIPLIKNFHAEAGQKIILTNDEKEKLADWIGLSFTRVPSFRNPQEEISKKIAEITLENNILPSLQEEKLLTQVSLDSIGPIAQRIGESVLRKNWNFFKTSSEFLFITSDNPVFFDSPNSFIGPTHPHSEIIWPLRKDLALVCTPFDGNMVVYNADKQTVKKFNKSMAMYAERYIIASFSSDKLARLVEKYRETKNYKIN